MRTYLKKSKNIILTVLFMFMALSSFAYATENSTVEFDAAQNVRADKVWRIKFSKKLQKESVNNVNIKVEKVASGKSTMIYPKVVLSEDGQTVLVNTPIEGYTPRAEYYVIATQGVKSEDGISLKQEVKKKFTIENQAIDESNHENLPRVEELKLEKEPIINGDKQKFIFKLQGEGKIDYKLFLFKFGEGYKQIAEGSENAGTVLEFLYDEPLNTGKYKSILYVKKANAKGTYEDSNTDFHNYKIVSFMALDKIITENVTYMDYNMSFDNFINKQFSLTGTSIPKYEDVLWINTSKDLLRLYAKPENFLDDDGKYMFLKLNFVEGITKEMLKELLDSKGIFTGKEEAFLEACEVNDINPVYFIMHVLHETSNGKSELSNGVEVNIVNGQPVEKKKTYNIAGIKAEDDDPVRKGSEYAYTQEWFDIDSAIMGAAKYVSERYINKPANIEKPQALQNTLYKMRWNPATPGTFQYATDIRWAYKQSEFIKKFFDKYAEIKLEYEVPKFLKTAEQSTK